MVENNTVTDTSLVDSIGSAQSLHASMVRGRRLTALPTMIVRCNPKPGA
jgi:hypothetical protein